MKKFLSFLGIFFLGLMFFFSCEEPPPPIPDCEREGYGWLIIENATGYQLQVDGTYTSTGENYEKWLNNGQSYTYKMDAGKIYIWASFDGNDWVYDTYILDPCEELTYTWYLNKKKSTSTNWWDNYEVLYVDKEGNVVRKSSFTHYGQRNL
jgi:hypothetical protein